ncbi:MAG TPA: DUF4112 domain-containing protein [Stellaceae bacterium]|jgi:hypothetical protein|nr:DUF4112 domain-containing protein [Stellaceae bacterium]
MLTTGTWAYRDRAVPLAKIQTLRRLAWLIDAVGRVPGTRFRFGINSVIGLAPGIGDGILALVSLYFVYEAVLGAVPVIGDLFDVVWKANLRNVDIIDRHFGMLPR